MVTTTEFVDRLPDGAEGQRWVINCPAEGYQSQFGYLEQGVTGYLDFEIRLEGTESHALLRVFVTDEQLIADARRPGVYRLISSPVAQFLTQDSQTTLNLAVVKSGFVNVFGCIPDTPAGEIRMIFPASSTSPSRKE